jgi:uncharacterized integral membrane protein
VTFKGLFNWTVGLPIAVMAVGFAVANRQWISVSFDPFNRVHPFATIEMPLWAVFFCGIFAGIFAGWLVSWLNHGKYRRAAREARIELIRNQQTHERETRELKSSLPATRPDATL